MGFCRVIEFDAENSFIGNYKFRMPVIPADYHGTPSTVIAEDGHESIEDVIADLEYYGVGDSFISLFTDLRMNNIPTGNPRIGYEPNFLLHQIYPSIANVICPDAETLSNSIKIFDRTLILPIVAGPNNEYGSYYTTYQDGDAYLMQHSTKLYWSTQYFYGFGISLYGVYSDQLNGNKFDFSGENQDASCLYISVARTTQNTWYYQIIVYGGVYPIGINLKTTLDGHETDDADQDSDDPYDDGGDSGGGGGGGSYDDDSDDVDFPPLPDISATDTGFVSLYVPSATQLKDLANYMWNNNLFDIDSFKKLFADPMDCVIGLSIVPYAVPTSGAVIVNVGNIPTGISMNKASAQFFILDCGSINISEYFGSYLDYAPYTNIQIFLPYIGYRELKIDECMAAKPGMAVHLKYYIDILSGACTALIKCGRSMMFQFQGHCSVEIPFTGVEWGNAIKSAIDGACAVGNLAAENGNPINEVGALANSVMGSKPSIERSGHIGSAGGLIAGQHPYLIITRPRQCKPKNQNHYLGYPAFITENFGGISGFTQIEECRLNGIKCNDEEMEEIMRLLKEGVIL